MDKSVKRIRDTLLLASVSGVDEYCRILETIRENPDKFHDRLAEAHAALMFARSGFQVTMRESPDLEISGDGFILGAEIKHFRKKEQDRIDEERMLSSDEIIAYGNTLATEGISTWDQILCIIDKKLSQLLECHPNLLVIVSSSSGCLEEVEVETAKRILNEGKVYDQVSKYSRLNGLMFLSSDLSCSENRNVYFFETSTGENNIPNRMRTLLRSIKRWHRI